eukprot:TRINITY_DN11179_c0_g1_i5.p1 TRINITY_DN11179_c0_g1~~TRINITY_DN11179_c0_g1_i5.p1  ORF type:complete len:189 (-),score=22.01 TRINITY_DN11179_c0_g1_i5:178-744(-)
MIQHRLAVSSKNSQEKRAIPKRVADSEKLKMADRIVKKALQNYSMNELCDNISQEFESHGLILTEHEIKELARPENCSTEVVIKKINDVDLRQRFKAFSKCMTIDDLLDDAELFEELERIIQNPNHELTRRLNKDTLEDLSNSLKALKHKTAAAKFWRSASLWKVVAPLLALGVLISALAFYYARRKD